MPFVVQWSVIDKARPGCQARLVFLWNARLFFVQGNVTKYLRIQTFLAKLTEADKNQWKTHCKDFQTFEQFSFVSHKMQGMTKTSRNWYKTNGKLIERHVCSFVHPSVCASRC